METTLDRPEQAQGARKPLKVDREQIKVLYVQGMTIASLAERFRISPNSLANWVRRGNWSELRTKLGDDVNRAVAVTVNKGLNKANQGQSDVVKDRLATELELTITALSKTKPKNKLEHLVPRSKTLTSLAETASKLFGWGQEAATSQALTLLCLSSSDAVQQGLVKPIEVESTVQPQEPVQASTEQKPQQIQDVQVVPSTGTEQGS